MTDLEALNLLIASPDKISSQRLDYLMQTLGIEKLFLSEEFNQLKQGLRYLRDNSGGGSINNITEIPNRSYNDLQDLPPISYLTVATLPLTPEVGVIYLHTADNRFKWHNGTSWMLFRPRRFALPLPRTVGVRAEISGFGNLYFGFTPTNNQTAIQQSLGVIAPNLVTCGLVTFVLKVPYKCVVESLFVTLNTSQTISIAFYSCDDATGLNQEYLGQVSGFNQINLVEQTALTWNENKFLHMAVSVDGITGNRWINGCLITLREIL